MLSKPIVSFGTSLKKSEKRHAILSFFQKLTTLSCNLRGSTAAAVVAGGCGWFGVVVGGHFALLGGPLGVLGRPLGVPGATWGSVWALWVRLGTSLGGWGRHFGLCWPLFGHLGPLLGPSP